MKPSDCHSALAPSFISRPAMPRKLAADRYSPEIAAAFHHAVTEREATSRSDVVRTKRTPHAPRPSVPRVTAPIASRAVTFSTRSRKAASSASARRA